MTTDRELIAEAREFQGDLFEADRYVVLAAKLADCLENALSRMVAIDIEQARNGRSSDPNKSCPLARSWLRSILALPAAHKECGTLARLEALEAALDKAKAWLEACDTWDVGHAEAREAFREAMEGLK